MPRASEHESPDIEDHELEGAPLEREVPPMMTSLDEVLPMPEEVHDLRIVQREFADGVGRFEALHHAHMAGSLMMGSFESRSSDGGVTRYEGTLLSDPLRETPIPSGQGSRTSPDGSVYTGQWKDGFPDGQGEWRAPPPSCESYIGEWRRGRKHGFGAQKYANGDSYEGDWADGKFQDRGKYIYANGDEFTGLWDKGVKVQGTFYFKDGRVSTRKWQDGRLVTCQDFDSLRRTYQPTISKVQVHDPSRTCYGTKASLGMISPRGIKIN